MPRCAPDATTVSHSRSGAVEPTPSLMFLPLGVTPIAITSAPSSHKAEGAT